MRNSQWSEDALVEALNQIINTETPRARAETLQAYYDVLISDEALRLLSNNLESMRKEGDEEMVEVLTSVLRLLELSREKGLEAGLVDLETAEVERMMRVFVNSESWAERKRLLEDNREALLSQAAQQLMEGLIEANLQNQDGLRWLRASSAMLEVARKEGVPASIIWLQEQMLGSLSKLVTEGEQESGSQMIAELRAIGGGDDWIEMNRRIAEILMQYSRGEADADWIVDKISEAIDQAPGPAASLVMHLQLIEFLVTGEDEGRIEQAVTRLCSMIKAWEESGNSFEGVYGALGRTFLFREKGERQENLRRAKEFFEQELEACDKEQNPQNWALTERLLGTAYEGLGDRQAAIQHLEQGLSVLPPEANEGFAGAALSLNHLRMGNLGAVGDQLAVEAAIGDLNRGLRGAPENTEVWALIHSSLGDLFRQRQTGDPAKNLEQAYSHTNQALRVFTRETDPDHWAQMQHNLGTIYYSDSLHDRADNLEKAIEHYRHTLEVHTKEEYSQYYGLTNSALGMALLQRISGKRERNFGEAFQCFKEAEGALDPETSKVWWAECMTGLGSIYSNFLHPDRKKNLLQAAEYMDRAREAYAQLGIKERENVMLSNLAKIYIDLGELDPDATKRAVKYAEGARDNASRETNPYQWALFNRNLAAALINQREKSTADRSRAKECLHNALEVFTPEAYLAEYRLTTNYLGHIYFEDGSWAAALDAYQSSIQAGEALLSSAYTEPGRRAEVRETELAHIRAAYCLVQLQRLDEALVMVESGKARLIAEKLAYSEVDLAAIPEELAKRLLHARENVRALEGQMRLATSLPMINTAELGTRLREARARLDDIAQEIRRYNPSYGGRLRTVEEIIDLIPENGALVAFIVTLYGTIVFSIPAGTKELQPKNVSEIPDFSSETLDQLLDEQNPQSWVALIRAAEEIQTSQQFKEWLNQQAGFMNALWTSLIGPVHTKLLELGLKPGSPVLLLAQGGLWLLGLHAASRAVDGRQQAFADDYVVIYTPSIYARKVCIERNEDREDKPPSLLAVVNPGGDLPYSDKEVSLISHHFRDPILLHGKEASLEKVVQQAGNASYLHFSCHGYHDWADTMLSGLELAAPDHLLLSGILAKLSLNQNRLVTLSACDTGIIDLRGAPDEFVGLPTGFLVSGANGVITTLWKVDDAASCLLVSALYEHHFAGGKLAPEALRAAQRWLRDLTMEKIYEIKDIDGDLIRQRYQQWIGDFSPKDKIFDNPFFWAGFAYIGG